MNITDWENHQLIGLTYEEEREFARSVIMAIADRNVWGDFQTLLDRIFFLKSTRGTRINALEFLEFLDFAERYGTTVPNFKDTGTSIRDETYTKGMKSEDHNIECRRMVVMAWQEVYTELQSTISAVGGKYSSFPADSKFVIDPSDVTHPDVSQQDTIEQEFWTEVDKIQQSYGSKCSRHDAYVMASDYMPRGDFTE